MKKVGKKLVGLSLIASLCVMPITVPAKAVYPKYKTSTQGFKKGIKPRYITLEKVLEKYKK